MPSSQDDNRPRSHSDPHPHVLIVGGGVAGCTLAYTLSTYPLRITLVEAGRLGQGASGVPVALLNPYRGRTARASELDQAGLEATRALATELAKAGLESGIHFPGVLRIASSAKQARKWQKLTGVLPGAAASQSAAETRWLDPADVPAPYHAPFGSLMVGKGGWLEPETFLKALMTAASGRGVRLLEACQVTKIEDAESGKIIHTSAGVLEADKVVLCVGATETAGLPLPQLERLAGDIIGLSSDVPLPYPIAGAIYGARNGAQVFMGGNHRPAGTADPDAATLLQKSSGWFVKPLRDADLASIWTGVRAKKEDNQPLVQELRPGLWFFGALAGRGFLCSAFLAKQLAAQLS